MDKYLSEEESMEVLQPEAVLPIFPGENFLATELEFEEGTGFVVVNEAYINYPNKRLFPWSVQVLIEYQLKHETGLPTDEEASVLNEIEDEIVDFLKVNHQVHFIARLTRKDYRDLLYYIDQPGFDQKKSNEFFEKINLKRKLNFNLEKDEEWRFVSGLFQS